MTRPGLRRALLPRLALFSLALAMVLLLTAACGSGEDAYSARIVRTAHGVAHIYADDLPSLGYGEGYAQAQDHLCTVADQVVKARGERARWFGPGEEDAHLQSDITMKALRIHERAGDDLARQPQDFRDWYDGYVAGYNEYLGETGVDAVSGWCRGAEWVAPITAQDLAAYHRVVTVTSVNFASMIATAEPPTPAGEATSASAASAEPQRSDSFSGLAALDAIEEVALASNGWALGRDLAAAGKGMLLANPHYPWVGSNRFWEKHLVIPGELDIYGVGLIGIPGVAIGFNEAVAWTHTVSAGKRFTLYALDLVHGSPTRYRYDDGEREMTSRTVEVEVRGDDGTVETVQRTVWFSHYGPILDFPNVGWSAERVLALRDANEDNDEGRLQWMAMNRAGSLAEFQAAHAEHSGIPWVNTVAASAEGTAWYADTSSTPHLSEPAIARWQELRDGGDPLVQALWQRGMVVLPGGDSAFEWLDDVAARDPGVVPYAKMPQIERADYVFNANDSYWLPNSQALLTGYSPLHGDEGTQRSLRTRNNDLTLSNLSPDQPAGDDGKFTLDELGDAILSNRSLAAEMLRPELLGRCARTPRVAVDGATVDLSAACEVLAGWNDRFDLDSRGAVLFRELMGQYTPADLESGGRLFAVPFDPADPIGTPRGLAPAGPQGDVALQNLARAVRLLESRGIALDATLGELQYADKAGRRMPVHGGHGAYEGVMNMQQNSRNTTSLEPMDSPPSVEGSRFLTESGYPVVHGSSFLMVLEYTEQGPNAKAFLTYGQSGDPESPHFTDQTELYAKKEWRKILFDQSEIEANKVSETKLTSKQRRAAA
ncbi:MAG TPA: acylase [Thermoanaerobaculia bacterium]|nr:acylase [Thermoanaerobaculia bacterium]